MSLFAGEFEKWDVAFIFIAIILCMLGRACNTFSFSYLANIRRKVKISLKMQCVLWFAGLRGAIAFALALTMPGDNGWNRDVVVTTTLMIVMFTTVICGGLTEPLLTRLDLKASTMNNLDNSREPLGEYSLNRESGNFQEDYTILNTTNRIDGNGNSVDMIAASAAAVEARQAMAAHKRKSSIPGIHVRFQN